MKRVVAIAAVTALCIAVIHTTEAHSRPECPAEWPDWGFTDQWTGPVWHIDRHGDRWVIFGSHTHYRAYRASERYRIGYITGTPHEVCFWSISRQEQIVFPDDD